MSIWLWISKFLVPIVLAWPILLSQLGTIKVLMYVADGMFVANILINFVLIRPESNSVDPMKNALTYLKTWFLLDCIVCLPALCSYQSIWS